MTTFVGFIVKMLDISLQSNATNLFFFLYVSSLILPGKNPYRFLLYRNVAILLSNHCLISISRILHILFSIFPWLSRKQR